MKRTIERRKVYEQLADILRAEITSGVYKIGEELPSERAMMQHFKVGRPAVREALSHLALMGLIEIRPGMRARVCRPSMGRLLSELAGTAGAILATPSGFSNMKEIRALLETALARRAAKLASPKDMAILAESLDQQERCINNPVGFAAADVQFHMGLARMTENSLLCSMASAMYDWLLEQRITTLTTPGQLEKALQSHKDLYNAIQLHDADAAEECVHKHLKLVQTIWFEPDPGTDYEIIL